MDNNRISRRSFIRKIGQGGAVLTVTGILAACAPGLVQEENLLIDKQPDIEINLKAAHEQVQILSGAPTKVWKYIAQVISGPQDAVMEIPGSYLGPILQARTGQHVRVHFTNELDEKTIVHWHGLHVPESADGHPRLVIDSGESYQYDFVIMDRAGTYWYHPHPHGRTGPQAYFGLAGLFLIHDAEEDAAGLPTGEYDVPIVIQDRDIDENNQFVYSLGTHMMQTVGFLGSRILINGFPDFELNAATHPYRLRLLNGSNARIYKLAWENGKPITVIGTDGGLLAKPVQREYITLAPGQRLDLWVDLSDEKLGTEIKLVNLENETPGGDAFEVLTLKIVKETSSTLILPTTLSSLNLHSEVDAVNVGKPRTFELQMGMGMTWLMNGRIFEMNEVASDEKVQLGDLETWEFKNEGGRGMGLLLPHPMHIHGLQFQVLERKVYDRYSKIWKTISNGLIDEGWHDTVLVMPGERVRILLKFEDFRGLYLYHCHNLEHEDMGMMRNYEVV